jgi:hypothetical protein
VGQGTNQAAVPAVSPAVPHAQNLARRAVLVAPPLAPQAQPLVHGPVPPVPLAGPQAQAPIQPPTWSPPAFRAPSLQPGQLSQRILTISDEYRNPSTTLYPYTTSNPPVFICQHSILWNICSTFPGFFNDDDASVDLLKRHILLASHCQVSIKASSASFGSALSLEFLDGIAQTLAPGLLASIPLQLSWLHRQFQKFACP